MITYWVLMVAIYIICVVWITYYFNEIDNTEQWELLGVQSVKDCETERPDDEYGGGGCGQSCEIVNVWYWRSQTHFKIQFNNIEINGDVPLIYIKDNDKLFDYLVENYSPDINRGVAP